MVGKKKNPKALLYIAMNIQPEMARWLVTTKWQLNDLGYQLVLNNILALKVRRRQVWTKGRMGNDLHVVHGFVRVQWSLLYFPLGEKKK